MGAKAQLKLDVVSKVEQGKIPRKQARQILGKSERTLERYIAEFRREGVVFVKHGNQGKRPKNKIDDGLKQIFPRGAHRHSGLKGNELNSSCQCDVSSIKNLIRSFVVKTLSRSKVDTVFNRLEILIRKS